MVCPKGLGKYMAVQTSGIAGKPRRAHVEENLSGY